MTKFTFTMPPLLPCPFCGGPAFLSRPTDRWVVECRRARHSNSASTATCNAIACTCSESPAEACSRWNTRADRDASPQP